MPVGNSLDIINTSNHLSAQWEGRVQARARLPQEALAALLLPLPKGLGLARLRSCWRQSTVREGMWERRGLILISGLLGDSRVWAEAEKPGLEGTAGIVGAKARERVPSYCSQVAGGMPLPLAHPTPQV